MSEVNANNLLSPTEASVKYSDDTPEQIIARKIYDKQVRQRLESLDASSMSFQGTGTVQVVLRIGGKQQIVMLPIRSIPADTLAKLSEEYQKIAAQIPRSWNPNAGEWDEAAGKYRGGWDQDPSHPKFASIAMELTRLTKELTLNKILHGIDIPLKDARGNIVWDPDDELGRDPAGAVEALKRLKLSEEQLSEIETAIDNLSLQVEVDDEEEFIKKP